jgi:hypothetical protein
LITLRSASIVVFVSRPSGRSLPAPAYCDRTVVYDACVLYPAPLRDLLMRLALTDLYRARWTEQIRDEWTRNVLRQRPDLKAEDLQRTCELMNLHVRDSLVTGYEHLVASIAAKLANP